MQLKTDCGTLRCGWKHSNLQCEGWSKKYSLIRHTKKKFILSVRNGCGVFLFVKVLKFNLSDAYWYNMILTHFSILKDLKNYEIWLTPILNCHFDLNTAIFRKASIFLHMLKKYQNTINNVSFQLGWAWHYRHTDICLSSYHCLIMYLLHMQTQSVIVWGYLLGSLFL